tara:strand:+ start:203 stop:319 length:117 start_codon:yes stop_codon:yes gene_type:complete
MGLAQQFLSFIAIFGRFYEQVQNFNQFGELTNDDLLYE